MTSPKKSMHRGHNSSAKPDEQMGRMSFSLSSAGKRVLKKRANAKRRARGKKLSS